jgi:hypothetical protein
VKTNTTAVELSRKNVKIPLCVLDIACNYVADFQAVEQYISEQNIGKLNFISVFYEKICSQ